MQACKCYKEIFSVIIAAILSDLNAMEVNAIVFVVLIAWTNVN